MVSSGVWNGSESEAEFFGALLNWAKRTTAQAIGHELLQPLAVQYVRLAPGDVFDVARVDQQYREAARFQQLEQRDPVALGQPIHAGGFDGDGVDPTGFEPIGQCDEVDCDAGKLAHRFVVAVRQHGHKVGCAADVDA